MSTLVFRCHGCGGVNRVQEARLSSGPSCGRCKHPLDLDAHPHDLDDDALARLIRSSPVPVLVDFWAPWCGPCRTVAPHIEALAKATAGHLIVAKVDTDRFKRTAAQLQIRSIPTLAIWKDGELQSSQAGALMGPKLKAFVRPHLS